MNANCLLTYNADELTPRMTDDRMLRSGDKRSRESDVAESGCESDAGVKHLDEDGAGKNYFTPFYLVSEWSEKFTTRKCLFVAIDLSSGTHEDYDLAVVDNGNCLQLRVCWLSPMGNVKKLHHLWLAVEGGRRVSHDHSKTGGSEKSLREKRQSASEKVVSTAMIRLPFRVETEVSHEPLRWSGWNTSVLYV